MVWRHRHQTNLLGGDGIDVKQGGSLSSPESVLQRTSAAKAKRSQAGRCCRFPPAEESLVAAKFQYHFNAG